MAKDYTLTEELDIAIDASTGDFVVHTSDEHHVGVVVAIDRGQLRYSPLTGFGITRRLKGPNSVPIRRAAEAQLKLALQTDGATEVQVNLASWHDIGVNATYPPTDQ